MCIASRECDTFVARPSWSPRYVATVVRVATASCLLHAASAGGAPAWHVHGGSALPLPHACVTLARDGQAGRPGSQQEAKGDDTPTASWTWSRTVRVEALDLSVVRTQGVAAAFLAAPACEGSAAGSAPPAELARGPSRLWTHDGQELDSLHSLPLKRLTSGAVVYIVPKGFHFVWPVPEVGTVTVVPMDPGANAGRRRQPEVTITCLSRRPRIFSLGNFLSDEEADAVIAEAEAVTEAGHKLQKSLTGHSDAVPEEEASSAVRTSENAFVNGTTSAMLMRRGFELMRIQYDDSMADGLQVLRYRREQAYIEHTDFFDADETDDFNWDPTKLGSNRFATILLYLSDAEGGQTIFPLAGHKTGQEQLEQAFEQSTWLADMTSRCGSRFAVPCRKATAILFYSQGPAGELDQMSEHGGCPVRSGVKWAANLWVWNRARFDGEASETGTEAPISSLFQNPSEEDLRLFWVNQDTGEEELMATVPSKDELSMDTWHGHEFVARTAADAVVRRHVVDGSDAERSVLLSP